MKEILCHSKQHGSILALAEFVLECPHIGRPSFATKNAQDDHAKNTTDIFNKIVHITLNKLYAVIKTASSPNEITSE